MAEPVALRLHRVGDGSQRLSLRPQRDHFADRLLLGFMRDELAGVAEPEPERNPSAEVSAARLLVGFRLPDALADAVALRLGKSRGDGQEQLADPVARDVSAQVEQVELDAPALQALDDLERVEGRAEQAIELGRDDDVAPLDPSEQRAADWMNPRSCITRRKSDFGSNASVKLGLSASFRGELYGREPVSATFTPPSRGGLAYFSGPYW
jgi:hypothetical protein